MNTRQFILVLCVLAALAAAILVSLFNRPAVAEWLGLAIVPGIVNGVSTPEWFAAQKEIPF